MPQVAFVMSAAPHYPVRELAVTLQHELDLQGVPSSLSFGAFPEWQPDRVYLLLGPREFVRAQGEQALPADPILKRTIFLCDDRELTPPAQDHLELLRRAGAVFALDQRSVIALHRAGILARLLRPGYSKSLDHFDPETPRPLDVMFLGAHSLRRAKYLGRAARVLSRRNCLLQISEDIPNPGDSSSFLAQTRWPLLAQTKVLISIHHGDDPRFDWRGALDAIHAGAVVVSEHSVGIAPLVAGEHLLVASPDALPFVVEALIRDEERLTRLRMQAYERLSAWIPFGLSVSVLRAAVVELVGVPVPHGAALGSPLPAVPASGRSTADQRVADEVQSMRRELSDARRELFEVRRQLGVLQESVRAAAHDSPIRLIHQSPSWGAHRRPRLTVLTVLDDDRGSTLATLASLAQGRQRDFELLAVGAASGDRTLRAVRRWMVTHPRVPSRLLAPVANLGSGAARNIGLDFARGRYLLILDPGQSLYASCLSVLVGTLDALEDATFVYPIQEVTGEVEAFVAAGGDYLMSYLGWDPGRLRRGNYIHSPAMIRTDRLRELGGFATDGRLAGMEDYDLWCRIAERGWRGQLVPQELAQRIESGGSPALRTINPRGGLATGALMERSPQLMAGAFPLP